MVILIDNFNDNFVKKTTVLRIRGQNTITLVMRLSAIGYMHFQQNKGFINEIIL